MIKSQIKFLIIILVVLGISLAVKSANIYLQTSSNLLKANVDTINTTPFNVEE